jgi:DNA adenine methylase
MASLDRAARFIYLNRHCFNGLYRTNKNGQFNVPFSAARPGRLPTWEELWEASRALKVADLKEADFGKILTKVKKGDFVYLDPPYAVDNRIIFNQYGPQTFGLEDIERLRECLTEIHQKGAHFVLSYAFCREARAAFDKWHMRKVFTQRNISGFAKHRRRAAELIISNIEMSS